ncbi:hypothetical protein QVD17_04837 [Tagetes erecta]|uniref:Uncharacterized protein n=1 Tax=Tagetes erecta TaxID=13708 RepID=A0AAD8PB19_TARER|nr:hypothetical protein QVD17_04837 [Tagetes erecta]
MVKLMEQKTYSIQNWVQIHCHETQPQNDDDDEEALSLSHLATNQQNNPEQHFSDEQDEDFAFGRDLPENEMCTADELFFRGQILPLRHSVTLPSRFITRTRQFTRSVSLSEPVSVASSRSIRSSTSGSEFNGYRPRNRNQFHSHPSPTPQIRTRSFGQYSKSKSSTKWRFLRLGPVKVDEIGLSDLKNRRYEIGMQNEKENWKGCKCGGDVIESTVTSMVKPTSLNEKETGFSISEKSNVGWRKHAVSSHRTSEWLKQLFIPKNVPL